MSYNIKNVVNHSLFSIKHNFSSQVKSSFFYIIYFLFSIMCIVKRSALSIITMLLDIHCSVLKDFAKCSLFSIKFLLAMQNNNFFYWIIGYLTAFLSM